METYRYYFPDLGEEEDPHAVTTYSYESAAEKALENQFNRDPGNYDLEVKVKKFGDSSYRTFRVWVEPVPAFHSEESPAPR